MSQPSMRPETNQTEGEPEGLDPVLQRQQQLSAQLRAMFAHVEKEPVPPEFMDLLNRLDDEGETS